MAKKPSFTEGGPAFGEPSLLERDRELRLIGAAISRVRDGVGGTLVVAGPAGIGKTTLLEAAQADAEAKGLRVLTGAGRELEREYPFGLIRQLFETALATLAPDERRRALTGASSPAGWLLGQAPAAAAPEDASFALTHAIYWLTANLADGRPLLLAVDDLQLADDPSLRTLAYLVPRLEDHPVLLAVAVSGTGAGPPLDVLLSKDIEATVLEPAALSPAATAAVIRDAVGSASDVFCDACRRATGGNPFLARELALAAAADGLMGDDVGTARIGSLAPESVSRSTLPRIRRLGAPAAALAQALAVLEVAELPQAARLAGLDDEQAAGSAEALASASVLAPGLPLRFAHSILRSTVYEDVGPAARDAAHHRAAILLADGGGDPEAVGSHLERSAPRGESWASAALRRAARQALARGAPETAARRLRRALAEGSGDDAAELLHELGRAEALAGEPEATERLQRAYEAADDPSSRARILATLAETRFVAGEFQAAIRGFREALDESDARSDGPLEARLFLGYVMPARAYAPTAEAARDRIRSHAARSDGGGGLIGTARRAALAYDGFLRGQGADEVRAAAASALDDASLLEAGGPARQAFFLTTWALAGADGFDPAEAALSRAFDLAARNGSFLTFAMACHHRLWSQWRRGRIPQSLDDAQVALELADRGWRLIGPAAAWAKAECRIEIGDLGGAATAVEFAERLASGLDGSCVEAWPLIARSRLDLERGDPTSALESALRAGSALIALDAKNPAIAEWRSRAALASSALGDDGRARELWEEELALARSFGAPRAIGIALRTAGTIVGGEAGIGLLREATSILEPSPARVEHARALTDLGMALRRARRPREAREPLNVGLGIAREHGAVALATRAHDELLAAGARPRREALGGSASLTPRELRVAELAAGGLTNREIAQALFVTRKTVEAHMRNIFRKLGIGRREELVGMVSASRPDATRQASSS